MHTVRLLFEVELLVRKDRGVALPASDWSVNGPCKSSGAPVSIVHITDCGAIPFLDHVAADIPILV